MGKSAIRLLLNAEPFGFGPTAAVAALFPHLRHKVSEIAYIGAGHTLDLQKPLPYASIYDQNSLSVNELDHTLKQYDVLVTASDFDMARAARKAGLKVCIYDPLAWYWKKFPTIAREADLYLAQNFYGVEERLANEFNVRANCVIVPPIVEPAQPSNVQRNGILLNLGGLQNPHWPLEQATAYARTMIMATRQALPQSEKLIVATSRAIAAQLDDPDVKTYTVEEMRSLRGNCRLALMTPGLGNIFDAAAEKVPTLWLPPANDSQGQQADLLALHQPEIARIDWRDISNAWQIDYKDQQPKVLGEIAQACAVLAHDPEAQNSLAAVLKRKLAQPVVTPGHLIDCFGHGGARKAASAIRKYCYSLMRELTPHA